MTDTPRYFTEAPHEDVYWRVTGRKVEVRHVDEKNWYPSICTSFDFVHANGVLTEKTVELTAEQAELP